LIEEIFKIIIYQYKLDGGVAQLVRARHSVWKSLTMIWLNKEMLLLLLNLRI